MKKTFAILTTLLPLALLFTASVALAQPGGTAPTSPGGTAPTGPGGSAPTSQPVNIKLQFDNPFKFGDNLYDVVQAIVKNVIMPIGAILCVLAFIYAGFSYVTAQGNPTKISEAHRTLLYAAIGTAVLLGAWVIAEVVQSTVNAVIKK